MKSDKIFIQEIEKYLIKTAQTNLEKEFSDAYLSEPEDIHVLDGDERDTVIEDLEHNSGQSHQMVQALKDFLPEIDKALASRDQEQGTAALKELVLVIDSLGDVAADDLLDLKNNINNEFETGSNDNVDYFLDEASYLFRDAIRKEKDLSESYEDHLREEPVGSDIDLITNEGSPYESPDENEIIQDIDDERWLEARSNLLLLATLQKVAARLDAQGKYNDADAIDKVMIRLSQETPVSHTDSEGKTWTKIGPVYQTGMGGMKGRFIEWKDQDGNSSRFLKGRLPGPTTGHLNIKEPKEPGLIERGMDFVDKEVGDFKNMFSDKPLHEKISPSGARNSSEWFNNLNN